MIYGDVDIKGSIYELSDLIKKDHGIIVKVSSVEKTEFTGKEILIPSKLYNSDPLMALKELSRVYVDVLDRKFRPVMYKIINWFPHYFSILSLLSMLCIYDIHFIGFISFLFFLFPVRTKPRVLLLSRSYAAYLAIDIWLNYDSSDKTYDDIVSHFISGRHYWMCCNKDRDYIVNLMRKYEPLIRFVDHLKGDDIIDDSIAYGNIHMAVTGLFEEGEDDE